MIGWTGGTLTGALASSALPLMIRTALGVALYGMFIAIVIPQARAQKSILAITLISLVLSCLFYWIPALNGISSSLSVILCTVISAAIGALLFPIDDEENTQEALA
jgi:predicted branched-subunit amino acid permease